MNGETGHQCVSAEIETRSGDPNPHAAAIKEALLKEIGRTR